MSDSAEEDCGNDSEGFDQEGIAFCYGKINDGVKYLNGSGPADTASKEEMNEKTYPVVGSPSDPRFLGLRSLQTYQGRSRTQRYIIEGIRHLARAVEHSASIESVFLDPSVLSNPFGQKLARRLRQQGVPGIRLSRESLPGFDACKPEPQGIGAVLRQRWFPLEQLSATRDSLWLAVESTQESPGNLGTIIRTAEAAGVNGVFILNPNCDPYDPATIRATMGSLFSQKLVRCSVPEFKCWAKSNGISVVACFAVWADGMDFSALAYQFPAALIVGSEEHGLPLINCLRVPTSWFAFPARRLRFAECRGRCWCSDVRNDGPTGRNALKLWTALAPNAPATPEITKSISHLRGRVAPSPIACRVSVGPAYSLLLLIRSRLTIRYLEQLRTRQTPSDT